PSRPATERSSAAPPTPTPGRQPAASIGPRSRAVVSRARGACTYKCLGGRGSGHRCCHLLRQRAVPPPPIAPPRVQDPPLHQHGLSRRITYCRSLAAAAPTTIENTVGTPRPRSSAAAGYPALPAAASQTPLIQ